MMVHLLPLVPLIMGTSAQALLRMSFVDMPRKQATMYHVDLDGIVTGCQYNTKLIKPLILQTEGKFLRWESTNITNNVDPLL